MNILIDFIALVLLYVLIFFKRWRARGASVLLANSMMYLYLSFVLYFTLMPIITSLPFLWNHPYVQMNWIPFIDILKVRGDFVRHLVLNVIMMDPLGC